VGVLALIVVGGAVAWRSGGTPVGSSPTSPPSASPAPTVVAAAPTDVVTLTVSEALRGRVDGTVGPGPVTIRGYWTDRTLLHSCNPPDTTPGELEIRCTDGEFGITERDEPIGTLTVDYRFLPPAGPALTPFIDDQDIQLALFGLPWIHGQPYPPVPIVALGHFDDPRAAACRPQAQRLCRDRFVVDELIEFDPEAVPTPAVTLPPSPFPFDDPPPPPFGAERCAGDVPYAFVGWAKLADFEIDIGDRNEVVFIMITQDEVDLGDPGGPRARKVCFAREWEQGIVGSVPLP
jgi:hypothetical protein